MYFLLCPRRGLKIEGGVLHRVYILGLFCPKQGQGLKPSAAPLYPTIGQVPPPPGPTHVNEVVMKWRGILQLLPNIATGTCSLCDIEASIFFEVSIAGRSMRTNQ